MPEHTPAPTPSRAVYGFVMYLSFRLFFILYLLWAFIPEEYFVAMGITFLPQRYWAVSVPVYLLTVLTIFAFFIYPGFGISMTPEINDMRTIRDQAGNKRKLNGKNLKRLGSIVGECTCKDKEKCFKEYYESIQDSMAGKAIAPLKDLDVWEVSDELYLK
ncbi:unnamed protein product [Acanthoscelides obtectus]|uniref:PIG-P domain-containing protein n=1 Tax=Acanthoscelides obtectus TaxID=200917 RepID=A0A9P0KUS4_ACAOB|nr:unnamed protein product [Acanthoscelides obtectus]CAK1642317.1 Phosphatidylinositol N-acetylglucosaminyltransferase subunit P [Acanthoscelides obtectus]